MMYYLAKIAITTVLIVIISEVARRSTLAGAILASVPLVSVLALTWLYVDTRDLERVSALSTSVFWLVIPSLALFVSLPLLLKQGLNFYLSMGLAIAFTVACYFLMLTVLKQFGIHL